MSEKTKVPAAVHTSNAEVPMALHTSNAEVPMALHTSNADMDSFLSNTLKQIKANCDILLEGSYSDVVHENVQKMKAPCEFLLNRGQN